MRKFIIASVGAIFITIGMLIADKSLDQGTTSNLSSFFFVPGWFLIIFAVSIDEEGKFIPRQSLTKGLPALLVMIGAIYIQNKIEKMNTSTTSVERMIPMGIFFSVWILFASLIPLENDGIWNKKRAYWSYAGAILIVGSMMILFKERKFDMNTGRLGGPGNVYNPGLMMFIMGWLAIVISISGNF